MADNWFHKKGVTYNRTLFSYSIPTVGDEAQGTNFRYVSKWGNDILGNGSRANPYASCGRAVLDFSGSNQIVYLLVGTGVYREQISFSLTSVRTHVIGDSSNVIFEGTSLTYFYLNSTTSQPQFVKCYNLIIKNYQYVSSFTSGTSNLTQHFSKCIIKGLLVGFSNTSITITECYNTLLHQCANLQIITPASSGFFSKNTFCENRNITFLSSSPTVDYRVNGNIFWNNNIQSLARLPIQYSLFYQNFYRFNATPGTTPTYTPYINGVLQSTPSGFNAMTATDTLTELKAVHDAVFTPTTFQNCVVADPVFNGKEIGDFSLSGNSAARNIDYDGYQAGAFRIGNTLKINSLSGSSNFINTGATNLSFSADSTYGDYASLTTDSTADIKSNVLDLGGFYTLKNINLYGLIADRNGEWFSNERDLSASTISSGTTVLTTGRTYVVETDNIVWSGSTLTPSSKFSILSASSTSFSGTGVVREIWQKQLIQNFSMRFSETSFTADDITPNYFNFRWNEEISVNRTGNLTSGSPTYGNGDINFDNTVANIFSLQTRYLQFWVKIQNDNLV